MPSQNETELIALSGLSVPLGGGGAISGAVFLERPNRFLVRARLPSGEIVAAHCADRGRLLWLQPGCRTLLGARPEPGRKTAYQALAAWNEGAWASLDTHLPNRLVALALGHGALPPFSAYPRFRREVTYGRSRFDFLLENDREKLFLEVKSVGTVRDGVAHFPDAPTERGRRHLLELEAIVRTGGRAALLFVAQQSGARCVSPDPEIDPGFAEALAKAHERGVEIYAYSCPIGPEGITLREAIPVRMVA